MKCNRMNYWLVLKETLCVVDGSFQIMLNIICLSGDVDPHDNSLWLSLTFELEARSSKLASSRTKSCVDSTRGKHHRRLPREGRQRKRTISVWSGNDAGGKKKTVVVDVVIVDDDIERWAGCTRGKHGREFNPQSPKGESEKPPQKNQIREHAHQPWKKKTVLASQEWDKDESMRRLRPDAVGEDRSTSPRLGFLDEKEEEEEEKHRIPYGNETSRRDEKMCRPPFWRHHSWLKTTWGSD